MEDDTIRRAPVVELNPEQRTALERLARQRSLPARLVERARIVLLASDGLENQQIGTRLRRGVFRGVEELIFAIFDYIDQHNQKPKPFIWTAKAADILEKVKRAQAVLNNQHSA